MTRSEFLCVRFTSTQILDQLEWLALSAPNHTRDTAILACFDALVLKFGLTDTQRYLRDNMSQAGLAILNTVILPF